MAALPAYVAAMLWTSYTKKSNQYFDGKHFDANNIVNIFQCNQLLSDPILFFAQLKCMFYLFVVSEKLKTSPA